MAILISMVVACIVFYGVQLKGQWVTFWLTYLVTLSCGVGGPLFYLIFGTVSQYLDTTAPTIPVDLHHQPGDRFHARHFEASLHCPCSSCCRCDDLDSSGCCLCFPRVLACKR